MRVRARIVDGRVPEQAVVDPHRPDPQHMADLVQDHLLHVLEVPLFLEPREVRRVQFEGADGRQAGPAADDAGAGPGQDAVFAVDLPDGCHDHEVVDGADALIRRDIPASRHHILAERDIGEFRVRQYGRPEVHRVLEGLRLGVRHRVHQDHVDVEGSRGRFPHGDGKGEFGGRARRVGRRQRHRRGARSDGRQRHDAARDRHRGHRGVGGGGRDAQVRPLGIAEIPGCHEHRRVGTRLHPLEGDLPLRHRRGVHALSEEDERVPQSDLDSRHPSRDRGRRARHHLNLALAALRRGHGHLRAPLAARFEDRRVRRERAAPGGEGNHHGERRPAGHGERDPGGTRSGGIRVVGPLDIRLERERRPGIARQEERVEAGEPDEDPLRQFGQPVPFQPQDAETREPRERFRGERGDPVAVQAQRLELRKLREHPFGHRLQRVPVQPQLAEAGESLEDALRQRLQPGVLQQQALEPGEAGEGVPAQLRNPAVAQVQPQQPREPGERPVRQYLEIVVAQVQTLELRKLREGAGCQRGERVPEQLENLQRREVPEGFRRQGRQLVPAEVERHEVREPLEGALRQHLEAVVPQAQRLKAREVGEDARRELGERHAGEVEVPQVVEPGQVAPPQGRDLETGEVQGRDPQVRDRDLLATRGAGAHDQGVPNLRRAVADSLADRHRDRGRRPEDVSRARRGRVEGEEEDFSRRFDVRVVQDRDPDFDDARAGGNGYRAAGLVVVRVRVRRSRVFIGCQRVPDREGG